MTAYPVFIVGSPRSGTSILVRGLQSAGYFGFNEGNFLTLIAQIDRQVDRHFTVFGTDNPKVFIGQVDKDALKLSLAKILTEIVRVKHEGKIWFDKSGNPEMIEAIPVLADFFPGAHFIFAKRRAIENIVSRMHKFSAHNFEYHCSDWARNMNAWRLITQKFQNLQTIEVDQHDISESPEATAAAICKFLKISKEGTQTMTEVFSTERPQQTRPGSTERTLTLQSTGWSQTQIDAFHRLCAEEMKAFGYNEDASYSN